MKITLIELIQALGAAMVVFIITSIWFHLYYMRPEGLEMDYVRELYPRLSEFALEESQ